MSAKHFLLLVTTAVSLPLLASCGGKAPTGQVVANVNGNEVTIGELNQEAQIMGANPNDPKVRQQILQRVIDRKLIAGSAQEAKVDRDPEFLLARKRAEELMLSEAFVRKVLVKNDQPTGADLEKFMKSHPDMFDQRTVFSVDQLSFPPVRDQTLLKRLVATKTLDELESVLASAGIPRERTSTNWDSAAMPPDLVRRLKALPPGEVFIQTTTPMIAGVITGMKNDPLPPEARQGLAFQALKREQAEKAVQAWLDGLRRSAKIQYQPGYAPEAPGTKPTPAPANGERKI